MQILFYAFPKAFTWNGWNFDTGTSSFQLLSGGFAVICMIPTQHMRESELLFLA